MADTLGRPIELLSRSRIAMLYGGPVTDLVVSTTELTLMMAEAIDPKIAFILEKHGGIFR